VNLIKMNKTILPRFSVAPRRLAIRLAVVLSALLSFQVMAAPLAVPEKALTVTEKQVIELFFHRNLDLLIAHYNIDGAKAQEIIAAAIPNPTVSVQMLELSKNSNQGSGTGGCPNAPGPYTAPGPGNCGPAVYSTFSQLIEMAGKRGLRMKSSAIAEQAAESDFRDSVRILTNMARDVYYGLLRAQKNRWLAQEIVNYYKDIVRGNRLRLHAGDLAESDFMRINLESLGAQTDLDNAEASVEQAQAALAAILNWPDKSMQFVAADQWPAIKDIGQNLKRDALIGKAVALRPDLLGDKQRADQAEKDLMLSQRLKYPDPIINGGVARDPSNWVLNTGFVGVGVPVPLFYQYQGEESSAEANLKLTRVAAEETELYVRSDVVSALAEWKSAEKIVRRYENELLDHARKVRDRLELAYRNGAATVFDYIDAQRSYKAVMLDYNTAAINRINAYYDLAQAVGVEPDAELGEYVRANLDTVSAHPD
jgi:cobalt-zinc-cadmium efflux system outer membrane protein